MFISNKSEVWNIHAELSKVLIFFFKISFLFFFFFSPPLTWLSSPLIIMPRRFPGRGAAIRLNHLDKAAWPNYTRAPSGFDVAEKARDRGKLHSHIMVMIWFNPTTKLYVACLKKKKKDANANYEGAQRCGVGSRSEGWAEGRLACSNKAAAAGGTFAIDTRRSLINVVNENETNWTHFHLIMYPAQVKKVRGTERKHARNLPNLLGYCF